METHSHRRPIRDKGSSKTLSEKFCQHCKDYTTANVLRVLRPVAFSLKGSDQVKRSTTLSWSKGTAGFCRVLLGSAGFCRVLLGFAGFCWVLLGSAGFCRVLQGSAGICWVLQGSAAESLCLVAAVSNLRG